MVAVSDPGHEFLSPAYRELRVYSRTDAIRLGQRHDGHAPCFGTAHKDRGLPSAFSCGEFSCAYRARCWGLHQRPLESARIRETAIELVSRAFLAARSFERRGRALSAYQADVAALLRRWHEDAPQVAFLGAFSSGKSTLINRLLGRELLPHARTPTTAVLTSVAHASSATAHIAFRQTVEVPILTEHGRALDVDALETLLAWLERPRDFSVAGVDVIGSDGLARELRRSVALERLRRLRSSPRETETVASASLAMGRRVVARVAGRASSGDASGSAVYRVTFAERPALLLDLERLEHVATLRKFVTDPVCALMVRRVHCGVPVEALSGMQLLDTAGLCSPVGFHSEVTAELLERRPDKVVVLLDSRRLDSPTNRSALAALSRFVQSPEDYRRVTFALTFWDDAVRTYMTEDAEIPLDHADESARRRAADELGTRRRRKLRDLLENITGVASPVQPSIFLLGLGPKAPPEMGAQLRGFISHLQQDCAGWVGVDMWAERWRAGRPLIEQVVGVHTRSVADVHDAIDAASSPFHASQERDRLNAADAAIAAAISAATTGVRRTLESQREVMRLDVSRLGSRKEILTYLEDGYFAAANAVLDALKQDSERSAAALREVAPSAGNLPAIGVDRNMLGISGTARTQAKNHVTGVGYALQSVWDFFFSGLHEATADDRDAARAVIIAEMRGTFQIFERAVEAWCSAAQRRATDAREAVADRLTQLEGRRRDLDAHVAALRRKANHLERARPHVLQLLDDTSHEIETLRRAQHRARIGSLPGTLVSADVDGRRLMLKKGREADEWVLFDLAGANLRAIELACGPDIARFVPVRFRGMTVELAEDDARRGPSPAAPIPDGVHRFAIHIVTLRGGFYRDRRDAHDSRRDGRVRPKR